MNRVVWKYEVTQTVVVAMPAGAQIVGVDLIQGVVYAWALVDPDAPKESRKLRHFMTGEPIPPGWTHVGMFTTPDRFYIGHVFEKIQ